MYELSDAQYEFIYQFLPEVRGGRVGRPYTQSHRLVLEGILWKLRSGSQWKYMPPSYGNWNSVYRCFNRWTREGLFERIFRAEVEEDADLSRVMIDGTHIKNHICAHGARRPDPEWGYTSKQVQAIGWSKGGHTTNIITMADRTGRCVDFTLVPGNRHESQFLPLLVDRHQEIGAVLADRAYDDNKNLAYLSSRGIEVTIPPRKGRKHPQEIDWQSYRTRHLIENVFADLKQWRGIVTRDFKEAWMYEAALHLVMFVVNTRPTRRSYSPSDPKWTKYLELGKLSKAMVRMRASIEEVPLAA